MKYKYFVSYMYDRDKSFGFGSSDIKVNLSEISSDEIEQLKLIIKKENKSYQDVIILSIIPLPIRHPKTPISEVIKDMQSDSIKIK